MASPNSSTGKAIQERDGPDSTAARPGDSALAPPPHEALMAAEFASLTRDALPSPVTTIADDSSEVPVGPHERDIHGVVSRGRHRHRHATPDDHRHHFHRHTTDDASPVGSMYVMDTAKALLEPTAGESGGYYSVDRNRVHGLDAVVLDEEDVEVAPVWEPPAPSEAMTKPTAAASWKAVAEGRDLPATPVAADQKTTHVTQSPPRTPRMESAGTPEEEEGLVVQGERLSTPQRSPLRPPATAQDDQDIPEECVPATSVPTPRRYTRAMVEGPSQGKGEEDEVEEESELAQLIRRRSSRLERRASKADATPSPTDAGPPAAPSVKLFFHAEAVDATATVDSTAVKEDPHSSTSQVCIAPTTVSNAAPIVALVSPPADHLSAEEDPLASTFTMDKGPHLEALGKEGGPPIVLHKTKMAMLYDEKYHHAVAFELERRRLAYLAQQHMRREVVEMDHVDAESLLPDVEGYDLPDSDCVTFSAEDLERRVRYEAELRGIPLLSGPYEEDSTSNNDSSDDEESSSSSSEEEEEEGESVSEDIDDVDEAQEEEEDEAEEEEEEEGTSSSSSSSSSEDNPAGSDDDG